MANAWDLSDALLQRQLQAFFDSILPLDSWRMHLYQNDYVPIPGSAEVDYVPATFTGYVDQNVDPTLWGTVSVTAHVAVSVFADPVVFTAGSSGFSEQTIYGYFMLDGDGVYLYGERFATPRVMHPLDELKITPELRHKTATV